jgi:hypothetical protein
MKEAFEKMTGMPDAWTNPALMVSRNAFIQGWEARTQHDVDATIIQYHEATIKRLEKRIEDLAQPAQEPVAMRMPKVGDRVVCIEDESLGTVVYLTAGGSPEIKFDDGSHGTYMLREFAELFGYTTPQQRPWLALTHDERYECVHGESVDAWDIAEAVETRLKEKNSD